MPGYNQKLVRTLARTAVTPLLIAGCFLLGFRAATACDLPPLVPIPEAKDGAGKQEEILGEAQRYHKAMTEYADCILRELKAAGGDDAPQLTRAALVTRYNFAVAEVQAVLKMFNEKVGWPATATEHAARGAPPANRRYDNGGLDSAFPQFPNSGSTMSSGQPRPPGQ